MFAVTLPVLLIVFPGILMYFFSTETPAFSKAADRSALLIDPNNLSPEPTFAGIVIEVFFNCSTTALAAAINLASSSFLASNVASKAALFLGVAKRAIP